MKSTRPKQSTNSSGGATAVPQSWIDQAAQLLLKAPGLSESARAELLNVLVMLRRLFIDMEAGKLPVRKTARRVRELDSDRQRLIAGASALADSTKLRPEVREEFLGILQKMREQGIGASTTGAVYAEFHDHPIGTRGGAAGNDRGALRGQCVRRIAELYPQSQSRNTLIAELVTHIGFAGTRSDHVNSIIRQSRRPKK
jgi:hypothetical protein